MINSIHIKNYRGIKDMKVENFGKYNVFTGDNGSCKTTVLEALFMGEKSNAVAPIIIAETKGLKLKFDNIDSLFYNTKTENKIELLLNNRLHTEISIGYSKDVVFQNNSSLSNNFRGKFLYRYLQRENDNIINDIEIFTDNNSNFNSNAKEYTELEEGGSFITPINKINSDLANQLKELIENKRKAEILEIMTKFDSQIDDIISDGKEIKVSLKEAESFIPLFSLGNGLPAILDITVTMLEKTKAVYIDEIETGIHYLNYPKLCKVLVEISKEKDVQLFITTHSKEFLNEFYKTLNKIGEESVSLYRFEKIKTELKQRFYSKVEAIEAMEKGWDVR